MADSTLDALETAGRYALHLTTAGLKIRADERWTLEILVTAAGIAVTAQMVRPGDHDGRHTAILLTTWTEATRMTPGELSTHLRGTLVRAIEKTLVAAAGVD